MPQQRDFRGRKGALLSSHQNSDEMSGGLSKAGFEKLIHLVLQTESSVMRPISSYDMHLLGVSSLRFLHPEAVLSLTPSCEKR